ncbi:MAG: hypothetical protein KKA07_09190 [Bacteroidetes bacterium]|nr:hypothetical protein [Bacteroidota bacterium]MBU1719235.1 hypothetical protein [Bacteroidota bacterium]
MTETLKPLRFGVLCNSLVLKQWQFECIQHIIRAGLAEIAMVVVKEDDGLKPKGKFAKYFSKNGLYLLYDRLFVKPAVLKPVDISALVSDKTLIRVKTIRKGKFSEYFPEESIAQIRALQPDFMLRFGFGILKGEILDVPKYGIWSYHHADEQFHRGGPTGFWEIRRKKNISGVLLQRLTEKIDSGIILRKGWVKTVDHSLSGLIQSLYSSTTEWPVLICRDIQNECAGYFQNSPLVTEAPVTRIPGNLATHGFLFRKFINYIRFQYSSLFRNDHWQLFMIGRSLAGFIGQPEITHEELIPFSRSPRRLYRADPFGFSTGKSDFYLYEKYDYKTLSGQVYISENECFTSEKKAFVQQVHHSYPYIFVFSDNRVYCIPESCASGQTKLYEFDETIQEFKQIAVLLPDIGLVDPSVIRYNGRYWLFGTSGGNGSNTSLNIFYAETLTGKWSPHCANPVKLDIRSSRPAGTMFVHEGALYRPVQDSSNTYGGRIHLCRVEKLNDKEFSEMIVATINPPAGFTGIHTISAIKDGVLIDMKKPKAGWCAFWSVLGRKGLKGLI